MKIEILFSDICNQYGDNRQYCIFTKTYRYS